MDMLNQEKQQVSEKNTMSILGYVRLTCLDTGPAYREDLGEGKCDYFLPI